MVSDAENLQFVYEWRLEQEDQLRRERGSGMTNDAVMNFIDGCMFVLARTSHCLFNPSQTIHHMNFSPIL